MNISKGQLRRHNQQCEFPGCTNSYNGPVQQKYCTDQRCVEARKILAQKERKPKKDKSADNLVLLKGQFQSGTMLRIQCAACEPSGRCKEKFLVIYESNRKEYPKYCSVHRNAYKRTRFEGKINA